jgi:hypothetical protein
MMSLGVTGEGSGRDAGTARGCETCACVHASRNKLIAPEVGTHGNCNFQSRG